MFPSLVLSTSGPKPSEKVRHRSPLRRATTKYSEVLQLVEGHQHAEDKQERE